METREASVGKREAQLGQMGAKLDELVNKSEKVGTEAKAAFKELTKPSERKSTLLWAIPIMCILLWALGMATAFTLGGFIHVLVFVAVGLLLWRIKLVGNSDSYSKPIEK